MAPGTRHGKRNEIFGRRRSILSLTPSRRIPAQQTRRQVRQGAFLSPTRKILRPVTPAPALPLAQQNSLDPASIMTQQSSHLPAFPSRGPRLRYGARTRRAESFSGGHTRVCTWPQQWRTLLTLKKVFATKDSRSSPIRPCHRIYRSVRRCSGGLHANRVSIGNM